MAHAWPLRWVAPESSGCPQLCKGLAQGLSVQARSRSEQRCSPQHAGGLLTSAAARREREPAPSPSPLDAF